MPRKVGPVTLKATLIDFDPSLITSEADRLNPRTEGLHISQIYHDINVTVGRLKANKFDEEQMKEYQNMGFLWEHTVGEALRVSLESDVVVRPGEIIRDGIIGSPDLFDLRNGRLKETKATYKSFRRMGEDAGGLAKDFWIWKVQMMGYCHMIRTDECELIALFINGNYAPPAPMTRSWLISFTGREMQDNWSMITGHARKRGWLK